MTWTNRGPVYKQGKQWFAEFDCGCGVRKAVSTYADGRPRTKCCKACNGKLGAEIIRNKGRNLGNNYRLRHGHAVGYTATPTYSSWGAMRERCLRPNSIGYEYYGGRGITICERWDVFENFLADMGERPEGTTIDRIDSDGNYTPENCRWATPTQQLRNRRDATMITHLGETLHIEEWSERTGISAALLRQRMKKGWDMDRVFGTVRTYKRSAALLRVMVVLACWAGYPPRRALPGFSRRSWAMLFEVVHGENIVGYTTDYSLSTVTRSAFEGAGLDVYIEADMRPAKGYDSQDLAGFVFHGVRVQVRTGGMEVYVPVKARRARVANDGCVTAFLVGVLALWTCKQASSKTDAFTCARTT